MDPEEQGIRSRNNPKLWPLNPNAWTWLAANNGRGGHFFKNLIQEKHQIGKQLPYKGPSIALWGHQTLTYKKLINCID